MRKLRLGMMSIYAHRRTWLELMAGLLLVVGVIYVAQWGELRRQALAQAEFEAKVVRPVDGQVTERDREVMARRLQCQANTSSTSFRITQIRGKGNDYESLLSIEHCYVEADFLTAYDGTIVAAHDDTDAGRICGPISQGTWAELQHCRNDNGHRLATLKDFLSLPLSEWFIDLKSTQSQDEKYVVAVVKKVVEEIKQAGVEDGAVLMIYNAPEAAVKIIRDNRIRAGLKGYPGSKDAVRGMVNHAATIGFEMVCVNLSFMDPEIIAYSRSKNVWHLPWTTAKPWPFPED